MFVANCMFATLCCVLACVCWVMAACMKWREPDFQPSSHYTSKPAHKRCAVERRGKFSYCFGIWAKQTAERRKRKGKRKGWGDKAKKKKEKANKAKRKTHTHIQPRAKQVRKPKAEAKRGEQGQRSGWNVSKGEGIGVCWWFLSCWRFCCSFPFRCGCFVR